MRHNNLRRTLATSGIVLVLLLLLAGCGGSNNNSTTPTAQQLIQQAQAAIQKVTAYHFNLQTANLGSGSQLPIQSADGDIVVPDKLQATANVVFAGTTAQAQIIEIGDQQYINLLGGWQKTSGLLDPRALSDPQKGVSALLGDLQNPGTPTDSSSAGTPCWSITGKLAAVDLTGITGGGAPAGTQDNVNVCIGKSDHLPYLIVITGVAAKGDTAQTVRTFKLSKFNEKITIAAPAISS